MAATGDNDDVTDIACPAQQTVVLSSMYSLPFKVSRRGDLVVPSKNAAAGLSLAMKQCRVQV